MNELGKLSETEWENILFPSVYSSTHTDTQLANYTFSPFGGKCAGGFSPLILIYEAKDDVISGRPLTAPEVAQ